MRKKLKEIKEFKQPISKINNSRLSLNFIIKKEFLELSNDQFSAKIFKNKAVCLFRTQLSLAIALDQLFDKTSTGKNMTLFNFIQQKTYTYTWKYTTNTTRKRYRPSHSVCCSRREIEMFSFIFLPECSHSLYLNWRYMKYLISSYQCLARMWLFIPLSFYSKRLI